MVLTVVPGPLGLDPMAKDQGPQVHPPDQVFGGSEGRSAASETDVDSKIRVPRRKNYDMSSLLNPFWLPQPSGVQPIQPMTEHTCTTALTACGMSHVASHSAFPIMLFNM